MQTQNRLLDDLAKVANGAVSAASGVKEEMNAFMRQQMERLLADMELVSRDEFEAVKAVAAKARLEQEKLGKRLAKLEKAQSAKPAAKPAARAKATPKARAKA
jgi:BMFP domain-containing protein YqiC